MGSERDPILLLVRLNMFLRRQNVGKRKAIELVLDSPAILCFLVFGLIAAVGLGVFGKSVKLKFPILQFFYDFSKP